MDKELPYCEWCQIRHDEKTDHIERVLYLIPRDVGSDISGAYTLFDRENAAKLMCKRLGKHDGLLNLKSFKVKVTPE